MKIGVVFPQMEIGNDVEHIRDFATGAEQAGFDFLAAYDHVAGHRPADPIAWQEVGPYTDSTPFHEVLVLLSYLAGITSTLELVTEVLILPQRQTAVVAKQAAELHLLSGGRLRMGVGVGWNPEEYRALGVDFDDRGSRLVEQIHVLRDLWANDVITFRGRYHQIEATGIRPRPPVPSIPIWIGGSVAVALKRAAAMADGFVFDHPLEEAPAMLSRLRRHLLECNREPSEFGLAARVQLKANDRSRAIADARAWQELGITHLSVNTMKGGLKDPSRHLALAIDFMTDWRNAGQAELQC